MAEGLVLDMVQAVCYVLKLRGLPVWRAGDNALGWVAGVCRSDGLVVFLIEIRAGEEVGNEVEGKEWHGCVVAWVLALESGCPSFELSKMEVSGCCCHMSIGFITAAGFSELTVTAVD